MRRILALFAAAALLAVVAAMAPAAQAQPAPRVGCSFHVHYHVDGTANPPYLYMSITSDNCSDKFRPQILVDQRGVSIPVNGIWITQVGTHSTARGLKNSGLSAGRLEEKYQSKFYCLDVYPNAGTSWNRCSENY